jgi:hypothetical protein
MYSHFYINYGILKKKNETLNFDFAVASLVTACGRSTEKSR